MNRFLAYFIAAIVLTSCGSGKEVVPTQKTIGKADYPYIELFHQGLRLKAQGRVPEAIEKLEKCLAIKQTDDAVFYALSQLELMRNNTQASAEYIKKAAAIDPGNIWYAQELAYMYYEQGDFSESVANFKRLVEREPSNVDWLFGYSEALVKAGDVAEAIEVLNNAEDEVGVNPQLSVHKYGLFMSIKKEKEAIEELNKGRKEFPKDPQLIATLVDHYFRTGNEIKATEMLMQLIEADPENGRARLALAELYRKKGKKTEAYKELLAAFKSEDLDIDTKMQLLIGIQEASYKVDPEAMELAALMVIQYPNEAKAHSIYADFLLSQGKEDEALTSYKNALKYDKGQYPIWNQVLIMEYQKADYEALYTDSKACLEFFPTIATVYLLNGVAANQTKRFAEASESLSIGKEMVVNDKPILGEFYGQLGDANFGLKNSTEGKKYYQKAIEIDPNSTLLKNNFAFRLATNKVDLELAESLIQQALTGAPNQPSFIDTYGWVLFQKGKYAEAKAQFELAYSLDAQDAMIIEHLGDVKYKLADTAGALEWWMKAAEMIGNSAHPMLDKKIKEKKYYAPE